MAWPTTDISTQHVDDINDNASLARADIDALIDTINDIVDAAAVAKGIATLDGSSHVPADQLGAAAIKANNLSDLSDKDAALGHLGGSAVGKALFKAATKAAVLTYLGLDNGTVSATANRVVRRDANGRAKVNTPTGNFSAATKGYVDTAITAIRNAVL